MSLTKTQLHQSISGSSDSTIYSAGIAPSSLDSIMVLVVAWAHSGTVAAPHATTPVLNPGGTVWSNTTWTQRVLSSVYGNVRGAIYTATPASLNNGYVGFQLDAANLIRAIRVYEVVYTGSGISVVQAGANGGASGFSFSVDLGTSDTANAILAGLLHGSLQASQTYTPGTGYAQIGTTLTTLSSVQWLAFEDTAGAQTDGIIDAVSVEEDAGAWVMTGIEFEETGGDVTLTAEAGSYTLSGQAATLTADRLVTAEAGTYALSGQDVTLTVSADLTLTAETGAYTLTGADAALLRALRLTAEAGTYVLTGQEVFFQRVVIGEAGVYTLTGQAANLTTAKRLAADAGSYAMGGQAASLTWDRIIAADAGSYTLSGQDVTLTATGALSLTAEAGAYTVAGAAASLVLGRLIDAGAGTYVLTGASAGLVWGRVLGAEAGSYTLTGVDVALTTLTPDPAPANVLGIDGYPRILGADNYPRILG